MENFKKTIKNSPPFIERTIIPDGTSASVSSKLVVRMQYLGRKLLRKKK
jgi:hypothetical protein